MTAQGNPRLRAHAITKSFDGMPCLTGLELRVPAGVTMVMTGENGSGKTTLLNILSAWLSPDKGWVEFDGLRARLGHPEWLAQRGMARSFQEVRVFEQMAIVECLMVASYGGAIPSLAATWLGRRTLSSIERGHLTRVRTMLDKLALDEVGNLLAGELSYGQRKLLGVAQALLAPASLLVLDEPVAGLDAVQASQIVSLIHDWRNEAPRRSVLLVAHEADRFAQTADIVVTLRSGRIAGQAEREVGA